MIDPDLARTAWYAALSLIGVGAAFVGGMAFALYRERERQEWLARRREREMRRRHVGLNQGRSLRR